MNDNLPLFIAIFSLIIGGIDALRGSGWKKDIFSRPFWAACMGTTMQFFACLALDYSIVDASIIGLIVSLLMWLGLAPGWGKYFNVAYPDMKYVNEKEVKFIDDFTTKIYKQPANEREFSRWCFIAFTLRSLLFYPIFIGLSFFNPISLLVGIGVLTMPIVYWARKFVPVSISIRCAEFTHRTILGLLMCLSIIPG